MMFYHELKHDDSKPTIIFLHGLFSSHLEFVNVTGFLTDYNLILVDLPGHSNSKETAFSLDNATDALDKLITQKQLAGKVHIVGLSLGGFVALEFGRRFHGVAKSIFASGATPFRTWQKWFAEHPRLLYFLFRVFVMGAPDWLYWLVCRQNGS
jgi:pimeloyl-ACP methyl ester carboxylesterase